MSIRDLHQDWEDMAELDPFWAILSVPEKQYGKWNEDEFFKTGEIEVERLYQNIASLGYQINFKRTLDFGCGVGRLTRAFSRRFEESVGVDISTKMISLARELNSSFTNCEFIVNEKPDLKIFEDEHFDLIFSSFWFIYTSM